MEKIPTFLVWLKRQVGRDDPVGDLASDTMRFSQHPFGGVKAWRRYLIGHNACAEALSALDEAWKEYSATLPK